MTNKEKFISELTEFIEDNLIVFSADANQYFEELKQGKSGNDGFTENGKRIFEYLKTLPNETMMSAKDIGVALELTGKSVSGSMRKLVTNEYVEKLGKNPVMYRLTSKGYDLHVD